MYFTSSRNQDFQNYILPRSSSERRGHLADKIGLSPVKSGSFLCV